jgi:glutamyl-tRNA reductase
MLIFDLSIPRSVDPALVQDPGITLLNGEDLACLFEEKRSVYKIELMSCENSVRSCVEKYFVLYRQKLLKKQLYAHQISLAEVS